MLGSDGVASVMVEDDEAERRLGPGPVFLVPSVAMLGEPSGGWAIAPLTVPVGSYAAVTGETGPVRLLDLLARARGFPASSRSRGIREPGR